MHKAIKLLSGAVALSKWNDMGIKITNAIEINVVPRTKKHGDDVYMMVHTNIDSRHKAMQPKPATQCKNAVRQTSDHSFRPDLR